MAEVYKIYGVAMVFPTKNVRFHANQIRPGDLLREGVDSHKFLRTCIQLIMKPDGDMELFERLLRAMPIAETPAKLRDSAPFYDPPALLQENLWGLFILAVAARNRPAITRLSLFYQLHVKPGFGRTIWGYYVALCMSEHTVILKTGPALTFPDGYRPFFTSDDGIPTLQFLIEELPPECRLTVEFLDVVIKGRVRKNAEWAGKPAHKTREIFTKYLVGHKAPVKCLDCKRPRLPVAGEVTGHPKPPRPNPFGVGGTV